MLVLQTGSFWLHFWTLLPVPSRKLVEPILMGIGERKHFFLVRESKSIALTRKRMVARSDWSYLQTGDLLVPLGKLFSAHWRSTMCEKPCIHLMVDLSSITIPLASLRFSRLVGTLASNLGLQRPSLSSFQLQLYIIDRSTPSCPLL